MRSLTRCLAASMRCVSCFGSFDAGGGFFSNMDRRFSAVFGLSQALFVFRRQPPAAVWQSRRVVAAAFFKRRCDGGKSGGGYWRPPFSAVSSRVRAPQEADFLTQQLDLGLELFDIGF